jgi:hypothetical protein
LEKVAIGETAAIEIPQHLISEFPVVQRRWAMCGFGREADMFWEPVL